MLLLFACVKSAFATGEPSTYFNIYLPPNNTTQGRDVCLIVTALYDSTTFTITDDGADGDTDDTKTGMLMQGQSYVLFIRNNGVNDDAPHAGESVTKNDGDYLIVTSNKLVFTSQATLSDWQHNWVASFNKSSKGQKFIIYSNATSSSPNDINVFAYEDSTDVVVRKISTSPTTAQGYTNVNLQSEQIVLQRWLNVGQDLIYSGTGGRNLLANGCTYMIESNKPITVQYGALYQNERDGGGYVPSSNGSSAGDLFYFAVPYQANNEQEIRIVSWDNGNNILLERYTTMGWVTVQNFTGVDRFKPVQWVGATLGQTYATMFRVSCTGGKKVSVLEANWMETGSPGTSDMATMVSSETGTSAGRDFVVYMPPPSTQNNMRDPFTGLKLNQNTHAYVFAHDTAVITVKDCYTNGADLLRTYTIPAGRYADVNLTMDQWKSIYNGTGTTAGGPERPYLHISATKPVAVMVANTNDNWMLYCGSSLPQNHTQQSSCSKSLAKPGDTVSVTTRINIGGGSTVTDAVIETRVTDGAIPISAILTDSTTSTNTSGTLTPEAGRGTKITYPTQPVLDSSHDYKLTTVLVMTALSTDNKAVMNNDVVTVETTVGGTINGTYQQSSSSVGIANKAANTSNFRFTQITTGSLVTDSINSWNSCWTDIDGDNYQDIVICSYDKNKTNNVYRNNGDGTFTRTYKGDLTAPKTVSAVSGVFADLDSDGVNECITSSNVDKTTFVYKRNSSGNYNKVAAGDLTTDVGYGQTVNVVDYDNDGLLDVFIAEYFPSNMCRLYRNIGGCQFQRINNSEVSTIANYTMGSTWADYDNDGRPDLFIPVGGTVANPLPKNNMLFHNEGNGRFTRITTGAIVTDAGNSTASAWGDYDNDGHLDLFVANASKEKNCLYKNNGNGTFTKIDTGAIVNENGNWHGCSWVDVDNDGWLDMYVLTNDSLHPKRLYHNERNGYFKNMANEIVCAVNNKTMSAIWADYDRDGYQDVYVSSAAYKPNCLYKNNGGTNKWMSIRLVGTNSNKNGIGARVKLKCNPGGVPVWQTREVTGTSGIGSQNAFEAAFGMGTASVADSIVILWPSGTVQTITGQGANQFLQLTEPATSVVSGKVYVDANNNCTWDAAETGIANMRLRVTPGNILVNTDNSGNYSVRLPIGTYTIAQIPVAGWTAVCVAAPVVTVIAVNTTYSGNNIAETATTTGANLEVTTGSAVFRRGFKNDMVVTSANKGAEVATNATISVTFPEGIIPTSAMPEWSSVSGNIYTWTLGDLAPGANACVKIRQTIALTYSVGDTLTYTTATSTTATDVEPGNNTHVYSRPVVGAIDPNQITVLPAGEGERGYIADSQLLHYTVEFENLGTYEAANVIITDELPADLDCADFDIVMASHSCHYQLNNSKLQVFFDEINLPCRKDDPANCQGFVTFSVKPAKGVAPNTGLPNKADIIFDFEAPLATGSVLNTIYPLTMLGRRNALFVYPNPVVSGSCTIAARDYISGIELVRVDVLDITGRLVKREQISGTAPTLSLDELPGGTNYVLRATDKDGHEFTAVVSLLKR
jgi:hypothetical protein